MSTKSNILKAGVVLWPDITLQAIADKLGVSRQAIHQHFPDDTLKYAVAEHAVKIENSRVIVQLLADRHPLVEDLTPADRIKHFNAI